MKLFTQIEAKNPIEYIFSWKSPERIWHEKDKAWYVIYSFIFTAIVALLALIGEWVLIIAVLGFAFLWFVQGSVEPQIVEHVISSVGVKTFNKLYKWADIKCFWFSTKKDTVILNLDLINEDNPDSLFRRRICLIIDAKDRDHLFEILFTYLEYGEFEDVGINLFTELIYGKYVDLEEFMVRPLEENLEELIEEAKRSSEDKK